MIFAFLRANDMICFPENVVQNVDSSNKLGKIFRFLFSTYPNSLHASFIGDSCACFSLVLTCYIN
ncbi:hypothetical protein HMPREF3216_01312 [Gardnerella vaginalis]|uniref:Uncharacterized protein n=1 Tax=Gardnerella vaginalis TaxID=2702 RepID=A0A133NLW0_GARVA|nr:hypothetical protein HMPREF3216_01312 [Gardnerella vaginalis]